MDNIDYALVRLEILEASLEDIRGLYEIIWGLNTRYPGIPEIEKIEIARPIVLSLLESGLLQLHIRNWDTQEEIPIEQKNWNVIITDLSSWRVPAENGIYICFSNNGDKTLQEYNVQYSKIYGS